MTEQEKSPHREGIERLVMPHIRDVVSLEHPTDKWEDRSLHFPVDALFDALKEDGFEMDLADMRDNGWQWDWWLDVEKDGHRYTLSGSGFNGGLSFHSCED